MSPRSFVFSVWVANSKDATKTVAALETIAANNFTVQKEGGRVLVSASMGGKSYSYSLPPDQTAGTVAELAFYALERGQGSGRRRPRALADTQDLEDRHHGFQLPARMKLADRWKLVTRAFNPKAQSYDAARPSIQRRFPYNASAVDSHIDVSGADRERLMKLSRWLYNNAPFLRGLVNEKARYSVGSGIRPQARSGDEAWDLAAETFFEQWSRVADLQGRYTWREMQRIASIAIDRDGEVFFRATAQTTGYPALQLILAHRIGDARSSIYEPSNPAAREGGQEHHRRRGGQSAAAPHLLPLPDGRRHRPISPLRGHSCPAVDPRRRSQPGRRAPLRYAARPVHQSPSRRWRCRGL